MYISLDHKRLWITAQYYHKMKHLAKRLLFYECVYLCVSYLHKLYKHSLVVPREKDDLCMRADEAKIGG